MLYVVAWPLLSEADDTALRRLRAQYHPREADLIGPHFTLVFGADDGERERLETAVASLVGRRPFWFVLDRVVRHAEWGLRLTWDERAARETAVPAGSDASGTAYLARKRDVRDAGRRGRLGAQAQAERVYQALAREAADCRRHGDIERAPGSPVLLDAAFLVSSRHGATFHRALRRHEGSLRDAAIDVAFTGPWAPWNFV